MGLTPSLASQFFMSLIALGVVVGAYFIRTSAKKVPAPAE
jgi:hypothetical protein